MKSINLTHEILQNLDPSTILYAEFAEGGAMGCPGTARLFIISNNKLIFYLINGSEDKAHSDVYLKTNALLEKLESNNTLFHEYAGFGNHAYKSPKVTFVRDDDNYTFIYKKDGKTYKVPASCRGVYDHVVAKFTDRTVSIEELINFFNKTRRRFTEAEGLFIAEYLTQIKRNDGGESWFDFTVIDYLSAIAYIKHSTKEEYILNASDCNECHSALQKYRLKYVIDKIGWNKLDKLFVSLYKTNSAKIFNKISKAIGEDIEQIYTKVETIKSNYTELSAINTNNLESLFSRPILVDFTVNAHEIIIKNILESNVSTLRADAKSISYYLANYLLNEDKLPLTNILPSTIHIIENLPADDFNQTHTDDLFWVCSEIINTAWRYLEETDKIQEKFRNLIYNVYWPRIGSLWPIIHYNEFQFKEQAADKMFNESLSFIMGLEDISERNQEIKSIFKTHAKNISYKAGPFGRSAFFYTLKKLSSRQRFERILDSIEPQDYHSFLSRPENIEEAKLLLDELFRTDENARITGRNRLATFESLVLTPNTINVGEYTLSYINQNFDKFVEIISAESATVSDQPANILTILFIAMSKGITEENELPQLAKIKKNLSKFGCDELLLHYAEQYARHHRRTILFQRTALQKVF